MSRDPKICTSDGHAYDPVERYGRLSRNMHCKVCGGVPPKPATYRTGVHIPDPKDLNRRQFVVHKIAWRWWVNGQTWAENVVTDWSGWQVKYDTEEEAKAEAKRLNDGEGA